MEVHGKEGSHWILGIVAVSPLPIAIAWCSSVAFTGECEEEGAAAFVSYAVHWHMVGRVANRVSDQIVLAS